MQFTFVKSFLSRGGVIVVSWDLCGKSRQGLDGWQPQGVSACAYVESAPGALAWRFAISEGVPPMSAVSAMPDIPVVPSTPGAPGQPTSPDLPETGSPPLETPPGAGQPGSDENAPGFIKPKQM
jgi:hypothetical protein